MPLGYNVDFKHLLSIPLAPCPHCGGGVRLIIGFFKDFIKHIKPYPNSYCQASERVTCFHSQTGDLVQDWNQRVKIGG